MLSNSVCNIIILLIKQIGLSLRGHPILLITRMITDQTGLHSVLLPLLIEITFSYKYGFPKGSHKIKMYKISPKIIEYVKDLREAK